MEYAHIHLQTVSLGQVCFWPAAQVLNPGDAQSSCVIDCGADVAPLDVAFPIKLCIQSMSTTEGWMSAVRAFSLWCGKLSLKSPRKWRLYICHMKMLPQEKWGVLYNTLVPYSQVSVFTQLLYSLCCMLTALIRNFVADQRHLFSSNFLSGSIRSHHLKESLMSDF